jgi:HEAT repeat protein
MIMFSHLISRMLILLVMVAGGQSTPASGGAIPTVGELLKRHNIQLTQDALVGALRNSDPEVRYLAAEELAETKTYEAIPAIRDALASEQVPRTRENIAFALAQLGEGTGFDILEGNCRSNDASAELRTQSAEYMLGLDRQSIACLTALLDVLRTGTTGYKMQAASLLPRYRGLPTEQSEKVFASLVQALQTENPSVQIAAGRALADLGNRRALAELQEAVERARDEAIKQQLEEDLKILQRTMIAP